MELAEAADNEKIPVGMNLPDEIAFREDRIKAITEANIKIEDRAKERFEQEQSEYQDKLASAKQRQNKADINLAANRLFRPWMTRKTKTRSISPTKNHAS